MNGLTALSSISLIENNLLRLGLESIQNIEEKVVTLRITMNGHTRAFDTLMGIISRAGVLKRVILDGSNFSCEEGDARLSGRLTILKASCRKKGITLWKENFKEKGKVDLDS